MSVSINRVFKMLLLVAGVGYGAMSIVAFYLYWKDKRAAVRGAWRVPERNLHIVELLGGWPGALLAQRWLRHKTKDRTFRIVFHAIIALHVVIWVGLGFILAQ